MLKNVLQCYQLGKTEGLCMFYLLHVALHWCYRCGRAPCSTEVLRRRYVCYVGVVDSGWWIVDSQKTPAQGVAI